MRLTTSYYMAGNRQVTLYPVSSTRVISNHEGIDLRAFRRKVERRRGVGVDRRLPARHLVLRGDPRDLADIKKKLEKVVGWKKTTRAVFIDKEHHELMLTDDVLVKVPERFRQADINRVLDNLKRFKVDCQLVGGPEKGGFWRIRVHNLEEDAPLKVAKMLAQEENIDLAHPDFLQKGTHTQDPAQVPPQEARFFQEQWHLKQVNATGAWRILEEVSQRMNLQAPMYGDHQIKVVVHDCGVDIDHPDLVRSIVPANEMEKCNFDYLNNDPRNKDDAHGTACAGIIAASRGGSVVGVAPDCRIVPMRASYLKWSEWAESLRWAAQHGNIISCSWTLAENDVVAAAVKEVVEQGAVLFFASGNDNFKDWVRFPARAEGAIAVGASTKGDTPAQERRAPYSNCGPRLDFVAPSSGGDQDPRIETTDLRGAKGYNRDGDYCQAGGDSGFGGTSAATPLAAGVAALMLSVNPNLTPKEVRDIMAATAVKIGDVAGYHAGRHPEYGWGRIDAEAAVRAAAARP